MDYPLGTQSVEWRFINIWCCGKFIPSADIPIHAQLYHAEVASLQKTCQTTAHRRSARKTSLIQPRGGGSCRPDLLEDESAQLKKSPEMSAKEGENFLSPFRQAEYCNEKKVGNDKINDEATDETNNGSKITHAEMTSSVDKIDMKDTFEETNCVKGDTKMEIRAILKLHIVQDEEVASISDHCQKMYKFNLNTHREARGHGGEKRFSCDQCDYKAKRKYHLKMHKKAIHDGVTYSCDQCEYKAKWKINLKRHKESVHEGISHSCDQCDYTAKWKSYVKLHKESVHEDITYSCNQCDYRAKQKSNLKIHKECIHDGAIYSCNQCDYKAKWKRTLKMHKVSVHENCDQCNYKTKLKIYAKIHKEHEPSAFIHPCSQKRLT